MSCVEPDKVTVFESIFIVDVYLSVDDDVKTLEGFSWSRHPWRRVSWGYLVGVIHLTVGRGSGKVRRLEVPLGLAKGPTYEHCTSTVHLALYILPVPWPGFSSRNRG